MNKILEFDRISKTYNPNRPNAVQVFNDLSLDLAAGEIVGLVAPSGSGKSTLLHLAGLLDRADQGVIRILGKTPTNDADSTHLRRHEIGFVFQFHHLLPEFTALENVMLPMENAGKPRKEAQEQAKSLLEAVGLGSRLDHRPNALSGGEQQRVAIARALVNAPRLVLADEPTGNLDPENALRVFDLFVKIARQNKTAVLIATHNLELAARMDRVIELAKLRSHDTADVSL